MDDVGRAVVDLGLSARKLQELTAASNSDKLEAILLVAHHAIWSASQIRDWAETKMGEKHDKV